MSGETVDFFVANILIGSAVGQSVITPVDLVDGAKDETNQQVTNISRFLQTLDDNEDPSDGIKIMDPVHALTEYVSLNFSQSNTQFEADAADIMPALTGSFGNPRMLVSASDARMHLQSSLIETYKSRYNGTYSGDDTGKWTVDIDKNGSISGIFCSSLSDDVVQLAGVVSSDGSVSIKGPDDAAVFTGSITKNGELQGDWLSSADNESGAFSGNSSSEPASCSSANDNSGGTGNPPVYNATEGLVVSGDIAGGSVSYSGIDPTIITDLPTAKYMQWSLTNNTGITSLLVFVISQENQIVISYFHGGDRPSNALYFSLDCSEGALAQECNKILVDEDNKALVLNNVNLLGFNSPDKVLDVLRLKMDGTLYWK